MSSAAGPSIATRGLVLDIDMANTQKSWKGAPTTNYVANAGTMTGWNNYSNTANGTPAQFATDLDTTGYRMDNVGSWNGVYKSVTVPATGTYTFSAWIKWIGGSANVTGGAVYISGWGGSDSASATNRTLPGQWQRISITLNCTTTSMTFYLICWGGTNNADNSTWQVTMPQIEAGSFATPFVDGARSTNQAIVDLTGNSTLTINSLTYSSNNTFSFTGASSNNITVPVSTNSTNAIGRSWEAWVMPSATQTTAGLFGSVLSGGCTYYCNGGVCIWSGNYQFNWYDNANYLFLDSGVAATINVPVHIVGTYDASDTKCRIYINGVLKNTGVATNMSYGGGVNLIQIGYLSASGNYYTGTINNINHYFNYALSAGEVYQNFNAARSRYGL